MSLDLRPFVSSEFCLRCRGCCVFDAPDSPWLPMVTSPELPALTALAQLPVDACAQAGRLKTIPLEGHHSCLFLNCADHHCRVYAARPFECRLYPFLLSNESDGVRLYAHLSCPFVREQMDTKVWKDHLAVLRAFFSGAGIRRYIRENRALLADYSRFKDELQEIFVVRRRFSEDLVREQQRFTVAASYQGQGVALSAVGFANFLLWQDVFDFRFEDIGGFLCVFADQPAGTFLYLPPLGSSLDLPVIREVFARMRSRNLGGGMTRIDNVAESQRTFFEEAGYQVTCRSVEYIYERSAIAGLRGLALKSQRHDVNLVMREHHLEYRAYTPSDREACQRLFERWLDKKSALLEDDAQSDGLAVLTLQDSRDLHARFFEMAPGQGILGRVVLVDGKLAAYTFGYPLNEQSFAVAVEVADPAIHGLSAFIFQALAADEALQPFQYLNTMDDCGCEGLKRSKMSWQPVVMAPVYTVTEKGSA